MDTELTQRPSTVAALLPESTVSLESEQPRPSAAITLGALPVSGGDARASWKWGEAVQGLSAVSTPPTSGGVDRATLSTTARYRTDLWITYLATTVSVVATALFLFDVVTQVMVDFALGNFWLLSELIILTTIVLFLVYGNLVFQLTRIGRLRRQAIHQPTPRHELFASVYGRPAQSLIILVPSYKEDPKVVEQTLLSAALQQYPNRRVVLLLDDPPNPTNPADAAQLAICRRLPDTVMQRLEGPAAVMEAALDEFVARQSARRPNLAREFATLINMYTQAAAWFNEQAAAYGVIDHTDTLFVSTTFLLSRDELLQDADKLRSVLRDGVEGPSLDGLHREYLRLRDMFRVSVSSFERKRYVNLSHAANKASNLNSYIGLLGGRYREVLGVDGLQLEPVDSPDSDLLVPDAEYLISLDADSLLLPDYALRLVDFMEKPENARVAVVQTPYSAVPHPASTLERIAGATTDIQFNIHQGFSQFGATFWVGANALMRRSALVEICTQEQERGFWITKYIQDRTVIEDTESTVDLVARGWRLYNYPARLSYSATPPDFGALVIQRQRWANGGLIIMPKLLRYVFGSPPRFSRLVEGVFRIHYLASISGVNVGLLYLFVHRSGLQPESWWIPLTAAPYFYLYGSDLAYLGYRKTDLLRVYALNLILIPVNLAGVLKSIEQMVTGKTIPFRRTPKVAGRTAVPAWCLALQYGLATYLLVAAAWDVYFGLWMHALFSFVNALFLCYGLAALIGVRSTVQDIRLQWGLRLRLGSLVGRSP